MKMDWLVWLKERYRRGRIGQIIAIVVTVCLVVLLASFVLSDSTSPEDEMWRDFSDSYYSP